MRVVAVLDNVSRWGSGPGGSTMTFSANGNIGSQQGSISQAVCGNLGSGSATGNKRIVGQCVLKAAAPVLSDEFVLRFSNAAQPSGSIAAASASTISPSHGAAGHRVRRVFVLHRSSPE